MKPLALPKFVMPVKLLHQRVRSLCTSQGPPIRVGWTPNAGRGVYATRSINMGQLIHTAEPAIAHPNLRTMNKLCYFCLRRLEEHGSSLSSVQMHTAGGKHLISEDTPNLVFFCNENCAESAKPFYLVEKGCDWTEFHQHCREQGLRFPLLAKRLICMIISGTTSKDALDLLAPARLPSSMMEPWSYEKGLLVNILRDAGILPEKLLFLSDEWYSGLLSRIHLNCFRVEVLMKNYASLLAAAAESVAGESIVGSAVYIVPSMYNHDCDPNVNIFWPESSLASLEARREIKAGEELNISYIDASMSCNSRQQLLYEAYGFWCKCSRCREGD